MTPRAKRLLAFAGGVAGAALLLLATTQPWFKAHGEEFGTLDVSSDVAAPSITALAVAALALVGAVAIANTLVRRFLGIIQFLLGLGAVAVTATALADTVAAIVPAVSTATGIGGSDSAAAIITGVDVSLWPWIAIAGAGILMLTGAWTLATAGSWPASSSKYDAGDTTRGPASDWDALSEGADPTD